MKCDICKKADLTLTRNVMSFLTFTFVSGVAESLEELLDDGGGTDSPLDLPSATLSLLEMSQFP